MPALSTDKFKKVGNPGTATSLSAPGYTAGATSINVASTTNWPADTGVTFCMYEVTTVGTETVMTAGTYNEYDGVVTGATSIGSLSHVAGSGTDRNYAAGTGTVVTIMVTAGRENTLVDGLLVSHNQDGTLKAGAVDVAAVLASNVVETAKIKDLNVTTAKLANAAVTPAKWTNPYKFGVYRNAALTLTTAAYTKIAFDTEIYDTNNNFDSTTNHRYVAPVAGYYHFSAMVMATLDGGSNYFSLLYKNGSAFAFGTRLLTPTGTVEYGFGVSTDLKLAANDYIEVFFWNGSGGNKALITGTGTAYFNGHLISET